MELIEDLIETIALRSRIDAMLFDLDGTLVDTMDRHYQAYRDVFASYGGVFARRDFDRLAGPPAAFTIPRFAAAAGLQLDLMPPVDEIHQKKRTFLLGACLKPPSKCFLWPLY